ncbi:MAG: PEGA domain-containing protein [Candidatus Saccharibacteria bacterium]|nr:PEGA domain-containing protein [Candidatus Saccharibacteria bacterium]
MDLEKRARRESRRVIITEILMFVAVVVTVAILALLVSGYWLNSDLELERQGMLQISSVPTGADIEIDGESAWMQRTNMSKVLSSGEHTIVLTKEGYDSWSKTVSINEGLLYRLHYPRLFLLDRAKEPVLDASDFTMASISPNRNNMLLINNTTNWGVLNLDSDAPAVKELDISKVFSSVSIAPDATSGLFTGVIKDINWAKDNEHILFETESEAGREWVILNIKNPNEKVNLTREFAADFSEVAILNDSASSLLVVLNGNLHRVDVSSRQLSAILVEKVHAFDYLNSEVVFSADSDNDSSGAPYYVGLLKLGENKITTLTTTETIVRPAISKFYEDEFIALTDGATISMYQKQDFREVLTKTISFAPEYIEVGHNGEFITFSSGEKIATLDMEIMDIREWSSGSTNSGWLDSDMIYSVVEGDLKVYDFDGFNERTLASNVSVHFPITITNDKWLYYFSDGQIIREVINR